MRLAVLLLLATAVLAKDRIAVVAPANAAGGAFEREAVAALQRQFPCAEIGPAAGAEYSLTLTIAPMGDTVALNAAFLKSGEALVRDGTSASARSPADAARRFAAEFVRSLAGVGPVCGAPACFTLTLDLSFRYAEGTEQHHVEAAYSSPDCRFGPLTAASVRGKATGVRGGKSVTVTTEESGRAFGYERAIFAKEGNGAAFVFNVGQGVLASDPGELLGNCPTAEWRPNPARIALTDEDLNDRGAIRKTLTLNATGDCTGTGTAVLTGRS